MGNGRKVSKVVCWLEKRACRKWPHLFHCLQLRHPTQNTLAGNKSTIITYNSTIKTYRCFSHYIALDRCILVKELKFLTKLIRSLVLKIWMCYFEIRYMLIHVNILSFPKCICEIFCLFCFVFLVFLLHCNFKYA